MSKVSKVNSNQVIVQENLLAPKTEQAAFNAVAAVLFAGCAKIVHDLDKCLIINTAMKPAEIALIPCSGDPLTWTLGFASEYLPHLHKVSLSSITAVVFAAIATGCAVKCVCSMMPHKVVKIETKEAAPAA